MNEMLSALRDMQRGSNEQLTAIIKAITRHNLMIDALLQNHPDKEAVLRDYQRALQQNPID